MAGICWLLSASVTLDGASRRTHRWHEAEVERRELEAEVRLLGRFAKVMMYATTAAIASFVVLTSIDYAFYGLHPSRISTLYLGAAAYLPILGALLYWSAINKRKRSGPWRPSIMIATVSSVGYSIVGAILTATIMSPFGDYWVNRPRWVVLAIIGFTLIGALPARSRWCTWSRPISPQRSIGQA